MVWKSMPPARRPVNTADHTAPPMPVNAMHRPMNVPALSANQRLISVGMASHRMEISPRPSSTAAR